MYIFKRIKWTLLTPSTTEDHVEFCGRNETSHLVLRVSYVLHQKRLECLSYQRPYLPGVSVTDTSSILTVGKLDTRSILTGCSVS